jgi:hypothetical protein
MDIELPTRQRRASTCLPPADPTSNDELEKEDRSMGSGFDLGFMKTNERR